MKIPKKIKIGLIWWNVKEVNSEEIDCDEHCCGDSSYPNQLIRIAKNMSSEMKELTLFHEIFHCIDGQLDHDLVEMLSNQIHQVLKDNKLLK